MERAVVCESCNNRWNVLMQCLFCLWCKGYIYMSGSKQAVTIISGKVMMEKKFKYAFKYCLRNNSFIHYKLSSACVVQKWINMASLSEENLQLYNRIFNKCDFLLWVRITGNVFKGCEKSKHAIQVTAKKKNILESPNHFSRKQQQ